ncbi:MAG TPA: endolytic transglycosylase MltG [Gaiellaceae bacterium]|nr:endolytic transglycosylase MltG [Gaiellaceae bacterium]
MAPDERVVRRRRAVALGAVALVVVAAVVAIAVAAPHIHRKHAVPPPPPPPHAYKVIFPEGFTRGQMVARIGAVAKIATKERHGKAVRLTSSAYIAASKSATVPCFKPHAQKNLEGFLFPSTYDFIFKTTSKQLVSKQLAAFCSIWRSTDLSYARSKNLTDYDVLTIASLVEGEAVLAGDRAKVAAVIYNRLHLGMTLAIDAALRYGLHIPGTESIHESQLQNDTPYNLRLHTGLPPTPINNPGAASIQAAAHPAHADYLFFVAAPDHKHTFFTASAAAFNSYKCAHGYGC